ncbi:molybdopterin-dependent oxidoreductase [Proteinivorax tanatarense]|uniref:Molybdopterin-dependent oxidoreductase n=1 Tax=Proteinivorax tanatarense TaxID=1260629 RepID=A0AAU7VIQ1_9FIRM
MSKITTYNSACPLDCWDACGFDICNIKGTMVVKGKKSHPITNGFVCKKAKYVLERVHSNDRITSPMLKEGGKWKKVSWDTALNLMAENLKVTLNSYGSKAIAHYFDSGAGGTLKNLEHRFFNLLGGVTEPSGSLCWAAGMAAIQNDFGAVRCHNPEDILNCDNIIIWGRNPTETNIHLMPFITKAQKKGASLITIDPCNTKIANKSDIHIKVNPSTDGFLALALAKIVLEKHPQTLDEISSICNNLEAYLKILNMYNLDELSKICGVSISELEKLALTLKEKSTSFYLGYGMQRYFNSGNSIRAINSLAMITNNIGVPGGGVQYADTYISDLISLDKVTLDNTIKKRFFPKAKFASCILNEQDTPIRFLYVSRANPAVTLPNNRLVEKAFSKVNFVVGTDVTFTDTMKLCDLVLPATTSLEEEDIIYTSMWHRYINYLEPVFSPIGLSQPEWKIFTELAVKLNLKNFPKKTANCWLKEIYSPLKESFGISLKDIKSGPTLPGKWDIPFSDGVFGTYNKKFNLLDSQISDPIPLKESELYFMTPHPKNSLHSQFQHKLNLGEFPIFYIHPSTALKLNLKNHQIVKVSTKNGKIEGKLKYSRLVNKYVLLSFEGRPLNYGNTQNIVTNDGLTDIGQGTDMYDTTCEIEVT